MLKIFIGFVIFAALAMYVIMQGGDSLDMGGEKHGADAVHVFDTGPTERTGVHQRSKLH